jgi:hypothetical protein
MSKALGAESDAVHEPIPSGVGDLIAEAAAFIKEHALRADDCGRGRGIIARLLTLRSQGAEEREFKPTHRHVKRGTTYEIVGNAILQCSANSILDEQPLVVYRGEDGQLWVRGVTEFNDGRFDLLSALKTGAPQ